jgi:hypothetical protein
MRFFYVMSAVAVTSIVSTSPAAFVMRQDLFKPPTSQVKSERQFVTVLPTVAEVVVKIQNSKL